MVARAEPSRSLVGASFNLTQIWQQVEGEPLPGELEVIPVRGQKRQFSSRVHGGQAQSVLLADTSHNYTTISLKLDLLVEIKAGPSRVFDPDVTSL